MNVKADGTIKESSSENNWSKDQQEALEKALRVFTKEYDGDRWLEISKCVEGKSKKDCVERYKMIVLKLQEMKAKK